jgi:autophagy-related protein 2
MTERAEVFPVGITLDYKPRRVDYRALRDGRTIELMNFFHFEGAEMTLRHITLFGASVIMLLVNARELIV